MKGRGPGHVGGLRLDSGCPDYQAPSRFVGLAIVRRELYRAAATADMDHYPPEYCPQFYFIEEHFLRFAQGWEMELIRNGRSLFYAAPSP
jgi:hypothetical protein